MQLDDGGIRIDEAARRHDTRRSEDCKQKRIKATVGAIANSEIKELPSVVEKTHISFWVNPTGRKNRHSHKNSCRPPASY